MSEKTTFKIDLSANTDLPEKPKLYGIHIWNDDYIFLQEFVNKKVKEGILSYNQKQAILEGLNALEKKHPDIEIIENAPRRYYRGGKQKDAPEQFVSTMLLMPGQIKWINSFVAEKTKTDISYSKADFMHELITELKKL